MKIVFISNLFNHHQKYLSDALFQKTNSNYSFIATKEMSEQLKKVGYEQYDDIPYVVNAFKNENAYQTASKKIDDADVIIYGSAPSKYVANFVRSYKLIFLYSERPLKAGNNLLKYLPRLLKWKYGNCLNKSAYMLCATAFTSADYAKFGMFTGKCYKWGYFPKKHEYDIEALLKNKMKTKILWMGRFLAWKHPDDVLKLAQRLKKEGYRFSIDIGGTGEMESQLRKMTEDFGVDDCVTFLGAVPSNLVRKHMENAGIYLFTSDRYEGWGAVLNESMNSGCAVIASHTIGSVPFLIRQNENGLIYHFGCLDELYERVKFLLDNPREQERIGRSAYKTIIDEWNADVAAERLFNLSKHILSGDKSPDLYESGPCSAAEIIADDWM